MAKNLYQSAFTAGSSTGKYRASMYDVSSKDTLKSLEDSRLQYEQNIFNQNVGAIADTLSLASTVAGRYQDLSDDISVLEEEYGEMERPKGIFGKLMQSTKLGLGLGEYKFGDETISARNIAVKGSEIKYKNMFDEAMSDISFSNTKVLSKPNMSIPQSEINWDDFMLGDQEIDMTGLELDSFEPFKDPNKIDFSQPYTMSLIK